MSLFPRRHFAAALALLLGAPSWSAPVRILVLGDSITQGGFGLPSYRDPLIRVLNGQNVNGANPNNKTYSVQFVGSLSTVAGSPPNPQNSGFPNSLALQPNHEGHYGWRADEILNGNSDPPNQAPGSGLASLASWISGYTADVVLVHLGTNDALQNVDNPDPNFVDATWGEIVSILNAVQTAYPAAAVFLAKLIPVSPVGDPGFWPQAAANVDALNAKIVSSVGGTSATPVEFTGFNAATMTADNVHPNSTGEALMGARWFSAIESVLDEASKPQITSAATASAAVGAGFSYAITAANSPTSFSASGLPANLTVNTGSGLISGVPTAAGIFGATIGASNVHGSDSESLVITVGKGTASVTLSNLSQTYDGSQKTVSVTTMPAGLNVAVTYNGGATAPVNAGDYAVVATVNDANYQGGVSGTLTVGRASAGVALSNLARTYDGNPKTATVTTTPGGLATSVTYAGASAAPVDAGSYAVVATVTDPNYVGSANGALVIAKASQTIMFSDPGSHIFGDPPVALSATSTSGLTVAFSVLSGPGSVNGNALSFTGAGTIAVRALQGGNANFLAAPNVDRTVLVAKGSATVTISGVSQTFDGMPKPVTVSTVPAGLAAVVTYAALSAPPSAIGSYAVVATVDDPNFAGSSSAVLEIVSRPRVLNLSTRAEVGTGGNILIPGFVVSGTGSKPLLIRAAGPALEGFGVTGFLARPALTLKSNGQTIASNVGWSTAPNASEIELAVASIGAFPFPAGSSDSAILKSLAPGAYTAETAGIGQTTGISLVEVYDVAPSGGSARLINLSARAQVGVGAAVLIPGLVIESPGGVKVLVRGIGPALEAFDVPGFLANPVLTVSDAAGSPIVFNDDWGSASNAAEIAIVAQALGAFPLAPGSKDSAVLLTLPPGAYTVRIAGVGDTTGVALMEIYEAP